MNDGAGTTPGPGGQQSGAQQPQNPAVPPQTAPPASPFPAHVQPQPPAGQQPIPPGQPGGFPPPAPGQGFPSGQPSYGYPPQGGGYGYPPQSGYGYPPLAHPGEPDWAELADQNEAATRRRKRLLMISGGVLALAAVVGIVATTLLLSGGKKDDKTVAAPSASASPSAADDGGDGTPGPPPTTPEGFLNQARTDTAPLTPQTLFAENQITEGNRQYTLAASGVTATKDCSAGFDSDLAAIAKTFGCLNVFRATYVNGSTAVTLAIADFPSSVSADKTAKAAASMTINALVDGGSAPKFCQGDAACRSSRTSFGRYYISTLAGRADGKSATAADKLVPVAARDLAKYGGDVLAARGKAAMAAAGVTAPAGGSPAPSSSPTG
ncbi:hypothetical protein [Kitasatospora sp. HPMI-4]|uniref:hypothetical protein n=1 Tax=Kitasatospora sp. HPMI-4 TaxID=3448443 RepID=UPI003F1A4A15